MAGLSPRTAALAAALFLAACAAAPPPAVPRAAGEAPHPAVILVSGCVVSAARDAHAAQTLAGAGYVVEAAPRGGPCTPEGLASAALLAAARVATRAEVDPARVHLVGWAEGGAGVIVAVGEAGHGIRSAAAIYPTCARLGRVDIGAPLLLLLGEADTVAPAPVCEALAGSAGRADRVLAIRYGGAGHGFDIPPAFGFWRDAGTRFETRMRDAALQDIRTFFGNDAKR
jgi:dienelactone hydrolase